MTGKESIGYGQSLQVSWAFYWRLGLLTLLLNGALRAIHAPSWKAALIANFAGAAIEILIVVPFVIGATMRKRYYGFRFRIFRDRHDDDASTAVSQVTEERESVAVSTENQRTVHSLYHEDLRMGWLFYWRSLALLALLVLVVEVVINLRPMVRLVQQSFAGRSGDPFRDTFDDDLAILGFTFIASVFLAAFSSSFRGRSG
jgi:hypothetical protein